MHPALTTFSMVVNTLCMRILEDNIVLVKIPMTAGEGEQILLSHAKVGTFLCT